MWRPRSHVDTGPVFEKDSFNPQRESLLRIMVSCIILNSMVQYDAARLDASFSALSDATRRGVLEQLGQTEASVSMLAERFEMTLTGMKKHIAVLEQAGLVLTEKRGRVRMCKLGDCALEAEAAWLRQHRDIWEARFAALDAVVEELKRKERQDEPE
ncbi:ArsR/SmtB family transcription factor [Novosphingobium rosa]|uniref:ArsR/SmtB family transcription factor n=1 Tax=Novosphingobium rosa TaxID=76978 RepID=UPI000A82F953|nr:metalloregulator ArsR/SmtB family transcription factor [Novosphingobium rosa]